MAAAALGVIAGAVIAPLTSLDYASMASYTNEGLIAVSLGGLGSVYGSVAGGLVLGVVEAVVSGYVSSLFSTAISLIILIASSSCARRACWAGSAAPGSTSPSAPAGASTPRPSCPGAGCGCGAVVAGGGACCSCRRSSRPGTCARVNITGIFCLTIVGLDLLTGIAGQVSLGQAGFMAIGGYTSAILADALPACRRWSGWSRAMAGSALVATVLGLVCGRLRGMYLAIITLAFGILVEAMANGLSITGGPSGIGGIPPFSVAGFAFDTRYPLLLPDLGAGRRWRWC